MNTDPHSLASNSTGKPSQKTGGCYRSRGVTNFGIGSSTSIYQAVFTYIWPKSRILTRRSLISPDVTLSWTSSNENEVICVLGPPVKDSNWDLNLIPSCSANIKLLCLNIQWTFPVEWGWRTPCECV